MTIGISTAMRDSRLQLILDAIDAASDEYISAHLLVYSGTRPATGAAAGVGNDLLADFTLPFPCGTISTGVLTFGAVEEVIALEYGVATWARITDADDVFVMDLLVTDTLGAGDVKIENTEIFKDGVVSCQVATITEGNP